MSKLDELLKLLEEDENIKRFKALERIIDEDKDLKQDFNELKNIQKRLVQKESNQSDTTEIKEEYNKKYEQILNHFLMSEYLDLLEVINNDLQMINSIITNEINMEFDE